MSLGTGLAAFGRGFSQGNNIVNAANTADLIRYRREEARRRNERQTILNRTSELANAQMELQIQKLQEEMTKQQNDFVATKFANFLLNGNFKQASELVNSNESLKQAMNAFGIDSFSSVDDYAPEFLKKLGLTEELAKNRGDLIVTNDGYNNYKLISREKFAGVLGLNDKYLGAKIQSNTLQQQSTNVENLRGLADTTQQAIADTLANMDLSDEQKVVEIKKLLQDSTKAQTLSAVKKDAFTKIQSKNATVQDILDFLPYSTKETTPIVMTQSLNALNSLGVSDAASAEKFIQEHRGTDEGYKVQLLHSSINSSRAHWAKETNNILAGFQDFGKIVEAITANQFNESIVPSIAKGVGSVLSNLSSDINTSIAPKESLSKGDIDSRIQIVLNKILKADSGAAVTDSEWQRFRDVFGDNNKNYRRILVGIRSYTEWQLNEFEKAKTLSGYSEQFNYLYQPIYDKIKTTLAQLDEQLNAIDNKATIKNKPPKVGNHYEPSQSTTSKVPMYSPNASGSLNSPETNAKITQILQGQAK